MEEQQIERMLNLYKQNFDLSTESIQQVAEHQRKVHEKVTQELLELKEVRELHEEMVRDIHEQTERLMKITAALIKLKEDLEEKINQLSL